MKASLLGRTRSRTIFARLRELPLLIAVVLGAFAIYLSNGQTLASYDSAPNSLLAFNVLENHRLDFDGFRGSYFSALGGQYAFTEAPNGHLSSVFPIGTAIVTLPMYAAFYFARQGSAVVPLTSPAFEPFRRRYEKIAAAAVAAFSVALFLLCVRELGDWPQAAIATAVYALATPIWSIGSQALWQHGSVNLVVLALIYALFRASRSKVPARSSAWLIAAGIFAGLLPVIRPTATLFTVAALIFVIRSFGARGWIFCVACTIGVAPGLAWNAYAFHSLAGGYAVDARSYAFSPEHALTALAALLVSPSRGILVFSPVLAFSVFGAVRAWRMRERTARLLTLLALACAGLILQYAFFHDWWGGYAYGPRFLTDTAAIAALLLAYVIPHDPLCFIRSNAGAAVTATAFALLFGFSVAVQFAGTNSGAAGSEWNAVPISIDRSPQRVWQIADSQIERNFRAAYVRFFAWNIARSPGYDRGLAAHVTAVSTSRAQGAPGSSIDATAVLRNDGRSPVYGFASGIYAGQMRVRVRVADAANRTSSEQFLYVESSAASGERANAAGTLVLPVKPGTYVLECDPVVVGGGALNGHAAPFRVSVQVGARLGREAESRLRLTPLLAEHFRERPQTRPNE